MPLEIGQRLARAGLYSVGGILFLGLEALLSRRIGEGFGILWVFFAVGGAGLVAFVLGLFSRPNC